MKVIITETISDEYGFEDTTGIQIETPQTKITFHNLDDCPEDATLNRGLSDAFSIESVIKEAYEAGKNGEVLVVEYIKSNE